MGDLHLNSRAEHSASCKAGIWLMSLVTTHWLMSLVTTHWRQHSVANHRREDLSFLVFFAFKSLSLVLMNSWAHSLIPPRADSLGFCVFSPKCFLSFFPLFSFFFVFLTPLWVAKCTQLKDYLVDNCKDLLVAGWLWGRETKRIIVNPIRNEKSVLSTWDSKLCKFCKPL